MNVSLPFPIKQTLWAFLLLWGVSLNAQAQEAKEPEQEVESLTSNALLQGMELQLDYLKLATFFLEDRKQYEGNLHLRLKHNIKLVAEYGFADLRPDRIYNNATFVTQGTYWRAGLDYISPIDQKYELAMGFRYGQANYQEEANFVVKSDLHADKTNVFRWENLSANWFELIVTSDRKLWKGLHAGLLLRYRFLLNAQTFEPLDSYAIPGYGRKFNAGVPAANVFLKYRLDFTK